MKSRMAGRDFLTLMDFSKEEVEYFLDTAAELKRNRRIGESHEYLKGKTVASLFEKHPTRTRVSFQAGIAQLGAQSFYMRPDELQMARGGSIKDTARVIDRYCDGLFIRTSSQERVEEFAPFQINESVLKKAKGNVIFMHCRPAFHGKEMTDEVIDGPHSAVWDEAENRMHTQKAVLSLVIG